jgi:hypothetical protein
MTLQQLIERLRSEPRDLVVHHGFSSPHSYRGYYNQLAFQPAEGVTVGEMLADAEWALGKTFQGYRGGDFTMLACTPVWLAQYGCTGHELDEAWLVGVLHAASFVDERRELEQSPSEAAMIRENAVLLARHHKEHCDGPDCRVSLHLLRRALDLAGIVLSDDEKLEFI